MFKNTLRPNGAEHAFHGQTATAAAAAAASEAIVASIRDRGHQCQLLTAATT